MAMKPRGVAPGSAVETYHEAGRRAKPEDT